MLEAIASDGQLLVKSGLSAQDEAESETEGFAPPPRPKETVNRSALPYPTSLQIGPPLPAREEV